MSFNPKIESLIKYDFSIIIFNMKCHPELDLGSIQITIKILIPKRIDAETSSA